MLPRPGWVTHEAERTVVETAIRDALVGRDLVAVRYVELAYEKPEWEARRFHSIDYGVELDLADDARWTVIWQQESWNETLLASSETIRSQLRPGAEVSTWDVSEVWKTSLGRSVTSVEAVWTKHRWGPAFGGPRFETQVDDGHESDYCLVTLLLRASGDGCVVITLGGDASDGRGSFTYLADNVAVFFSVADARAAGVMLPGDPEAIP